VADGTRQRGPQTCGVAALHRHVRDELLQVIVGDVSWSAGSEPPTPQDPAGARPGARRKLEGAAVYEDSSYLARKVVGEYSYTREEY
jgi:hypothetical protein